MNYEDHINNELRWTLKQWITKITGTINYEDHIKNELRRLHEQWITMIT